MEFKEASLNEFSEIFNKIGNDWMLIAAGDDGNENMMTASWGAFGILWGKPVCICFVRPQRFTHRLLCKYERLSLTFFDEKYRNILKYCGSHTGADTDKVTSCGLTVLKEDDTPYFEQAEAALICRKLYVGKIEESGFIDRSLLENYKQNDFHSVFVCEIEKVLIK